MIGDTATLGAIGHPGAQRLSSRLVDACNALRSAVDWIIGSQESALREIYAGSVPYLQLWGIVCGGWMHARRLQAAQRKEGAQLTAVVQSASFYADHVLANASALATTIREGGTSVLDFPDTAWLE